MAAAAPANITAAAVAGKWNVRVARIGSDSALLMMVFNATGDPSTWTFDFPGRPPVPVAVTMDGDSIMTKAGPYTSALRKGVKVTTNGVMRLLDDKLVGTTTAHYQVAPRTRCCRSASWELARPDGVIRGEGRQQAATPCRVAVSVFAALSTSIIQSIGAPGFEPGTSCSQSRRDTRLRYAPSSGANNTSDWPVFPYRQNGVTALPNSRSIVSVFEHDSHEVAFGTSSGQGARLNVSLLILPVNLNGES